MGWFDSGRVAALIEEVAATEVLPRFRSLSAGDVREKAPCDLVTVADEAAERALTRGLADLLPGSTVVGEEAVAADANVLNRLLGSGPVWIVDPVDGTANFAAGKQAFGMIVALAVGDEIAAGWIYDPTRGQMVTAEKGAGAWSSGRRLNVAPPGPIATMSGRLWLKGPQNRDIAERSRRFAATISLRSTALEYLWLATAKSHFSFYRVRTKPWDHAAGVLIHAEAGGYAARLNGTVYRPSEMQGGLLMAPDRDSWHAILDVLLGDVPTAQLHQAQNNQ